VPNLRRVIDFDSPSQADIDELKEIGNEIVNSDRFKDLIVKLKAEKARKRRTVK